MMLKESRQVSEDNPKRQRMLDFARRLLPEGEKDYAEDIVQEAYARLLRHADPSQIKNLDNYLLRVVQNACNDRCRSRSQSGAPDTTLRNVRTYFEENVHWSRGADPSYPYEAQVNGDKLVVRLNDFPDAALYTLIVNGEEAADFDDWPEQWRR